MAPHLSLDSYRLALLFLATAAIVAPLFKKIKISPIVGYMLAGVLLGPYGLGQLPQMSLVSLPYIEEMRTISEIGVLFLLFTIGLELSFERLFNMRYIIFGLGALQVFLCALVIGVCAYALHQPIESAIVIGLVLSLSSTAIVMPALSEHRRFDPVQRRLIFAILLFQDLMVAPLLFTITAMSRTASAHTDAGLLQAMLIGASVIVLIVIIGRSIIRPLFRLVASTQSTESFIAACLLVMVAASLISAISGIGLAMGAFIAGLLLAETQYRREVEVTIEPFKGLLLGLFFLSIGASLNLNEFMAEPVRILAISGGLLLLKCLFSTAAVSLFRFPWPNAWRIGLVIASGGEFAFVLFNLAVMGREVSAELVSELNLSVTLTMLLAPALTALAARIKTPQNELEKRMASISPPEDDVSRVIVVGYGRVGRLVGQMLGRHNVPYLAIDQDPKVVELARNAGDEIYYGDATRVDFLKLCGLERARALVITTDTTRSVEEIVRSVRDQSPALTIISRARDPDQATHLYELGVTDAVPDTLEASLQLSEAVLVDIGIPMGYVIASIHEKRDEFRKMLQAPPGPGRKRHGIRLKEAESFK